MHSAVIVLVALCALLTQAHSLPIQVSTERDFSSTSSSSFSYFYSSSFSYSSYFSSSLRKKNGLNSD